MTYNTPGVYVEEISVFPPSVAEVETAIPAFIGYTERNIHKGVEYLNKPTVIKSLVDYEEIFGKGPGINVTKIKINSSNNVESVTKSLNFFMYESLRLFFANGGGKCYIISVGVYSDGSISDTAISTGLDKLKKEDEPTMILFPDAVKLSGDKLYNLQQKALKQAADLGDRFVIMDLKADANHVSDYEEFRNKIGMKNLKYGAAYMPYLKASLPLQVKLTDFLNKVEKGTVSIDFSTLIDTSDSEGAEFKEIFDNYVSARSASAALSIKDSQAAFNDLVEVYKGAKSAANFEAMITHALNTLKYVVDEVVKAAALPNPAQTKNNIFLTAKAILNNSLKSTEALLQLNKDLGENAHAGGVKQWFVNMGGGHKFTDASIWTDGDPRVSISGQALSGDDEEEVLDNSLSTMINAFGGILALVKDYQDSVSVINTNVEKTMYSLVPVALNIAKSLESELLILPPSGAIAGVYADTDNKRGVWKAPANVSLSSVSGLTEKIDNVDQDVLNIDVNAGKSINAIREFSGRGVLVWGARTLAGNDNEWRYVPVRRFFNMVEESIQKSTQWAVFEPNDANLWVKLKSMIENYLIQKWREGALAGAKPEQAFYVNVGLGKTMTAQDILEGRLIIDIGMAAVRPAEFIILRFMHKMQES